MKSSSVSDPIDGGCRGFGGSANSGGKVNSGEWSEMTRWRRTYLPIPAATRRAPIHCLVDFPVFRPRLPNRMIRAKGETLRHKRRRLNRSRSCPSVGQSRIYHPKIDTKAMFERLTDAMGTLRPLQPRIPQFPHETDRHLDGGMMTPSHRPGLVSAPKFHPGLHYHGPEHLLRV